MEGFLRYAKKEIYNASSLFTFAHIIAGTTMISNTSTNRIGNEQNLLNALSISFVKFN